MKLAIPPALCKAICENNLIIFVGAGLSCTLLNTKKQALGGWSNLVKQMLLRLQETGYDVAALLALIEENYDPIDILHLIEKKKKIPKVEVGSFIKEFLDIDEGNDFTLHTKIYTLSRKIITTNYDTAFEQAVQELRKNKAYKGKSYELTKHKDAGASLLFKLHGCFEDIGSMVLFPSDYTALYDNPNKDAEHSLLVLQNIIVGKSILFIGSGMGDFQINNIFRAVQKLQGGYSQQHFIITKTAVDSSLTFLTPVPIEDYADIGEILDDLLAIKEKCSKAESEESTRLRTELEETQKQRTELQEKIAKLQTEGSPYQQQLLQREALEHFGRGLQHNLSGALEAAAEEYERVTELLPASHEAFYNWGVVLADLAKTKEGGVVAMLYEQARDKYQKATTIKPDKYKAWNNWGLALADLAQTEHGEQADRLYKQACVKYKQAIDIKHDFYEAWNNWGNALYTQAQAKEGAQADRLYKQARNKYKRAIDIKHDFHDAWYNWGVTLYIQAQAKEGAQADRLCKQACVKYKQAIDIRHDFHEAWYNWGNALADLAKTKEGAQADRLYKQACVKYKQAIDIKHDFHEAWNNWGVTLTDLAKTKEGEVAATLYEQACEKYQQATTIKPNFHQAWDHWGLALVRQAQTKQKQQADKFFQQAVEKYKQAIAYGGSSYKLACLYALTGKRALALQHLQHSLSRNEIDWAYVVQDDDWKDYSDDPEFKALIKQFTT